MTNMPPDSNSIAGLSPLKRALLAIETLQARIAEMERSSKEPIAIVGIGCRFPGGPNPGAFWRLLQNGGDALAEVGETVMKDLTGPAPDYFLRRPSIKTLRAFVPVENAVVEILNEDRVLSLIQQFSLFAQTAVGFVQLAAG